MEKKTKQHQQEETSLFYFRAYTSVWLLYQDAKSRSDPCCQVLTDCCECRYCCTSKFSSSVGDPLGFERALDYTGALFTLNNGEQIFANSISKSWTWYSQLLHLNYVRNKGMLLNTHKTVAFVLQVRRQGLSAVSKMLIWLLTHRACVCFSFFQCLCMIISCLIFISTIK